MGRFVAIAIVVSLSACGKKSAQDDCLGGKADFLGGLRHSFDARINAMSPEEQPRARTFFDGKYEHARQAYEAYCKTVTEADWTCMHDVVERGGAPDSACKPAVDRFMTVVMDERDPDYH